MIYKFLIHSKERADKQFYMSADSTSQLYKRILITYRVQKEDVTLLEEYDEVGYDSYKFKKSYNVKLPSEEILSEAKRIFNSNSKKPEPYKSDYINKHKMKEISIVNEKDLYDLIKKYKTIKVYWENGEKRGEHKYYALVK